MLSFSVHLFGYLLLQESRPVEELQKAKKYTSSNLDKKKIGNLKQQLLNLMEQEKPYLEKALKLEDLANSLKVPSHHLSQVINTEFSSNFNEFINLYRVQEAKKMLQSGRYDSYSLEGIALESGFNNRTSFYRVFRKYTGTTPAKYKSRKAAEK